MTSFCRRREPSFNILCSLPWCGAKAGRVDCLFGTEQSSKINCLVHNASLAIAQLFVKVDDLAVYIVRWSRIIQSACQATSLSPAHEQQVMDRDKLIYKHEAFMWPMSWAIRILSSLEFSKLRSVTKAVELTTHYCDHTFKYFLKALKWLQSLSSSRPHEALRTVLLVAICCTKTQVPRGGGLGLCTLNLNYKFMKLSTCAGMLAKAWYHVCYVCPIWGMAMPLDGISAFDDHQSRW